MGSVKKITIALTPELESSVRDAVEAGGYASTSEVIREALREWTERRDLLGYSVDELRALAQQGIDSGISTRSFEDLKVEARRRAALKRQIKQ